MLNYLKQLKDHYKGHAVSFSKNPDGSYDVHITITISGVSDETMNEIARFLDIVLSGLSKGKLIIPIGKKEKKKVEESIRKAKDLERKRLLAYLNARGLYVEGAEHE